MFKKPKSPKDITKVMQSNASRLNSHLFQSTMGM
jgi:hypothetical protein